MSILCPLSFGAIFKHSLNVTPTQHNQTWCSHVQWSVVRGCICLALCLLLCLCFCSKSTCLNDCFNLQISQLEKKLDQLRSDKHQLFLQLKKVLNQEEETRRRAQLKEQRYCWLICLKEKNERKNDYRSAVMNCLERIVIRKLMTLKVHLIHSSSQTRINVVQKMSSAVLYILFSNSQKHIHECSLLILARPLVLLEKN